MPFIKDRVGLFRKAPRLLQWLVGLMVIQLSLELVDLTETVQYEGKKMAAQLLLWIIGVAFRIFLIEALLKKVKEVRLVMLIWSAVVFLWLVHDLPTLPHNRFNAVEDSINYLHACFSTMVSAFAIMVMLRPKVKGYLK